MVDQSFKRTDQSIFVIMIQSSWRMKFFCFNCWPVMHAYSHCVIVWIIAPLNWLDGLMIQFSIKRLFSLDVFFTPSPPLPLSCFPPFCLEQRSSPVIHSEGFFSFPFFFFSVVASDNNAFTLHHPRLFFVRLFVSTDSCVQLPFVTPLSLFAECALVFGQDWFGQSASGLYSVCISLVFLLLFSLLSLHFSSFSSLLPLSILSLLVISSFFNLSSFSWSSSPFLQYPKWPPPSTFPTTLSVSSHTQITFCVLLLLLLCSLGNLANSDALCPVISSAYGIDTWRTGILVVIAYISITFYSSSRLLTHFLLFRHPFTLRHTRHFHLFLFLIAICLSFHGEICRHPDNTNHYCHARVVSLLPPSCSLGHLLFYCLNEFFLQTLAMKIGKCQCFHFTWSPNTHSNPMDIIHPHLHSTIHSVDSKLKYTNCQSSLSYFNQYCHLNHCHHHSLIINRLFLPFISVFGFDPISTFVRSFLPWTTRFFVSKSPFMCHYHHHHSYHHYHPQWKSFAHSFYPPFCSFTRHIRSAVCLTSALHSSSPFPISR